MPLVMTLLRSTYSHVFPFSTRADFKFFSRDVDDDDEVPDTELAVFVFSVAGKFTSVNPLTD